MVFKEYSKLSKARSKILRQNMTDAELKHWMHIRKKQIKKLQFYRQKPLGDYIVDFYCPAKKLIIEVDGGQHYNKSGLNYDGMRSNYLIDRLGLKVLRFSNYEVLKDINSVLAKIYHVVE